MKTLSFDKLLLKTAICCMISDGHIDIREIEIIEDLCMKSPHFAYFDFHEAINQHIGRINSSSKEYIKEYFEQLSVATLSEQQELILIDFAIQTIKANHRIENAEINFFKNIRYRLKISDENILKVYPDLQIFLEQDILTETFPHKITNQYIDKLDLPQFDMIVPPGKSSDANDSGKSN